MRPPSHPSSRDGAFALILTLLILSVLAVVAVSFLASMSAERATASAFANKARAEQAARSGADSAMATLRLAFNSYPDSATVWDTQMSKNSDGSFNQGTSLYLRAVGGTSPDFSVDNRPPTPDRLTVTRKIFVLPLVSGVTDGKAKLLAEKADAIPVLDLSGTDATQQKFVDLNRVRFAHDTQGWIGSPPSTVTVNAPQPVRVPWVEMKDANDRLTARYAFWVEDESFKANVNYAALGVPTTPPDRRQRRDNIQNFVLGPGDVDLFGPLNLLADARASDDAQSIFDTRKVLPGALFPAPHSLSQSPDANASPSPASGRPTKTLYDTKPNLIDQLRFLTTTMSGGLNLSRHGSQRLNLNAVVDQSKLPTDTAAIQGQIDKIYKTTQFHAPDFGQRFYRNAPSNGIITDPAVLNAKTVSSTTPDHAKIYYYKVAANIRDYIDADSFPTCILDHGMVRPASPPDIPFGDNGDNPVWAIGKDAAPFMQEAAARYNGTVSGSSFTLNINYYIEFWNMSGKEVRGSDLGPHPFIRVSNPTRWEVNNSAKIPANTTAPNTPEIPSFSSGADLISDDADGVSPSDTRPNKTSRDYKIDLANIIFPAGQATVITTDASYTNIIKDAEALKHFVVCPFLTPGKSVYKGHFPPGRSAVGKDVLNMVFDTITPGYGSATNSSDFETDITIGSDYGYIDCLQGALPLSWGGRISIPYTGTSINYPYAFGGVMRGNWTNAKTTPTGGKLTDAMQSSALGDPRTNNEQLVYSLNPPSNTVDRSRFIPYDVADGSNTLTPTVNNPADGIIPTLGLPNYRSVRPNRPENPWADFPVYYADPNNPTAAELMLSAAKAPAVIANAPLTSIGQLGDVFDPARMIENGNTGGSRGGGRSFKIGQHDDRWDGDQTSASREWASWRLNDIFSITNSITLPGLININGVARDNGAALRAALLGFKYQAVPLGDRMLADSPDPNVASRLAIDRLVAELTARLYPSGDTPATGINQTGTGPLWERGELSELPGFGRSPDQYKPDRTKAPATYPTSDLNGSIDMSSQVFDRGREELFRRLAEMVTTRGNIFTVYALGQAISQSNPNDAKTRRTAGTQQLKLTFRLVPKNKPDPVTGLSQDFHPGTDDSGKFVDFNPNNLTDLSARFAPPDHYEVEILSSSRDNL